MSRKLLESARRLIDPADEDVEGAMIELEAAIAAIEPESDPIPPPSGSRSAVLFAAVHGGLRTARELAALLRMSTQVVSGHLIRLAADGWFEPEGAKFAGGRRFVPTARAEVVVEGALDGVRRVG